ncbi:SpoIIE family protein phosphatase [Streptomyces sp. WMMC940]|uniref:SpoIIE family protein phosphatase n=1 Tax=Streptomyces sp. WMMC940 TaxID=3015153 RepID=UPI0022B60775|nr:SpoIIE family protein phosphatase [Streptomyces sp. WMMC940]MCZ7461818.1 SpoIIE family protein phosphatase [Streptomyces sp. WMMC940]
MNNARKSTEDADFRGPLDVTSAATFVLDERDVVIGWSHAAQELLGYRTDEIIGRPVAVILEPDGTPGPGAAPERRAAAGRAAGPGGSPLIPPFPEHDVHAAVHRDGHRMRLVTAVCLLSGTGQAERVVVVADRERLREWESRLAMLQGLATESPLGFAIYDVDLRLVWCNAASEREIGRPLAETRGELAEDLYPRGRFVTPGYPETLHAVMRQVLDTGEPFLDLHFRAEQPSDPGQEHLWSCSYYRLQDANGHVFGVCEDAFDISDRYEAQRQVNLLVEAGRSVGTTLDVLVTAGELAAVAVPEFADRVEVDLAPAVLEGEVPGGAGTRATDLLRAASRPAGAPDSRAPGPGPSAHATVDGRAGGAPGERSGLPRPVTYREGSPQHRSLASGGLVLEDDTLVVPLRAGGGVLGLATFVRDGRRSFFDRGAVAVADELVARAAVSVDNARRYTRERESALALQRQLLPQHLPSNSAVDLAYRYLPTDDLSGVGGDWFDVIPLSGTRVGLVVGDVVGHGLHAAATMGRLRTTVRALAPLDLPPDELLKRLDDLVGQSAQDSADALGTLTGDDDVAAGATCLYAVYDPVSRRCTMARAGHLPPAVVEPGGRVTFPDLPAGPPLGLGGLPFECLEIELSVGSLLALFTDGLVEARDRDIDKGLETLARVLAGGADPADSLEDLCDRAISELLPDGTTNDDTALLLVRTRELDDRRVAVWSLPAEPVAAGRARELVAHRLRSWGLDELVFTTELIASELVTNAVRYAEGPLHLRLIHDRTLVCEVADAGHTAPHLRHSADDDEGGRGLFIVAQLVQRWGTRYGQDGKAIWTEQALPAPSRPLPGAGVGVGDSTCLPDDPVPARP